jgi:hypothetical protein
MTNADLPYYLAGFPIAEALGAYRYKPIPTRRTYWAASLGNATLAGHTFCSPKVIRNYLRNAGFTEILTTHDPAEIAQIVAELREAFEQGRRADLVRC